MRGDRIILHKITSNQREVIINDEKIHFLYYYDGIIDIEWKLSVCNRKDGPPKLINSVSNMEVSQINSMLDNLNHFTPKVVAEIKKCSEISIKRIDDDNVQLIITNNIPEKINYYKNGNKEEFYTKNIYFGTLKSTTPGHTEIEPSDLDVKVRIRADYSIYSIGSIDYYRLISGSGGLLNCWENGYRNLVVNPKVMGAYENPDGSGGSNSWLSYPRTIKSPSIGTMYSKSTNNSNYYSSAGAAAVLVDVSIEWRHGNEWGNKSSFTLTICSI